MFFLIQAVIFGEEIYVASVAGYRQPIKEIAQNYEKEKGVQINCIFGNKQQVITYINNSEKISMMIGDISLKKKIENKLEKEKVLGKGQLILAVRKDKKITSLHDLTSLDKIGIPDPKKTIYGDAAIQTLKSNMMYEKINRKLLPFLDFNLKSELMSDVESLKKEFGYKTIMVTHDLREIMSLNGEVICMENGRIKKTDSFTEDLFLKGKNCSIKKWLAADR